MVLLDQDIPKKIAIVGHFGDIESGLVRLLKAHGHKITTLGYGDQLSLSIGGHNCNLMLGFEQNPTFIDEIIFNSDVVYVNDPSVISNSCILGRKVWSGSDLSYQQRLNHQHVVLMGSFAHHYASKNRFMDQPQIQNEKLYRLKPALQLSIIRPGFIYQKLTKIDPWLLAAEVLCGNYPSYLRIPITYQEELISIILEAILAKRSDARVISAVSACVTSEDIANSFSEISGNDWTPWTEISTYQYIQYLKSTGLTERQAEFKAALGNDLKNGRLIQDCNMDSFPRYVKNGDSD